jgi:SAM-dependent methyltransferase
MVARVLMGLWPAHEPTPDNLSLNEIFRHDAYLQASPERQAEIRRASSQYRFEEEESKPFWLMYFKNFGKSHPFTADLQGKFVLDFGCFTGGRGAAWAKRYGIAHLFGCDINPIYMLAATEFATSHSIPNTFRVINDDGTIPFADHSMDTVVTFDVLEHVDDVERCMKEMCRVVKPGGYLYIVFPQFYQPSESHLDFTTKMPGLQIIIPSKRLTEAFYEEIDSRPDSHWYRPAPPQAWERLPCLNGITRRRFMKILKQLPLEILYQNRDPIFAKGKSWPNVRRLAVVPILRTLLATHLFDEVLLDRVAVVCRRT